MAPSPKFLLTFLETSLSHKKWNRYRESERKILRIINKKEKTRQKNQAGKEIPIESSFHRLKVALDERLNGEERKKEERRNMSKTREQKEREGRVGRRKNGDDA